MLFRSPTAAFRSLLGSDIQFSLELHEFHSREIVEQFRGHAEGRLLPAKDILGRFLDRLVTTLGWRAVTKDGLLILPLKRYELATVVPVEPETCSRLLRQLEEEGRIELRNGRIAIPHSRLRDLVRGGGIRNLRSHGPVRSARPNSRRSRCPQAPGITWHQFNS